MRTETHPQPQYKNAVVLYYWKQCGPCKRFAPKFQEALTLVESQLPHVTVYLIEVMEQREALQALEVDLGSGVPRLELYDASGTMLLYNGATSARAMKKAMLGYLGLAGGATAPPTIQSLSISPSAVSFPSIVLYYSPTCPFCRVFFPLYIQFAQAHHAGRVPIVAVDVKAHPHARDILTPSATSATVPHVVYLGSATRQVPFKERRTLEKLNDFYAAHTRSDAPSTLAFSASLTAGSSLNSSLRRVLQSLTSQAQDLFGSKYAELFTPLHAVVHMVAWRRQTRPAEDRLYILLVPEDAPRGRRQPVIAATITGKRSGQLTGRISTDVKVHEQVARKLRDGFDPVPFTDPAAQALRDAGYTLAASTQEEE